jgi:hypothetical protein
MTGSKVTSTLAKNFSANKKVASTASSQSKNLSSSALNDQRFAGAANSRNIQAEFSYAANKRVSNSHTNSPSRLSNVKSKVGSLRNSPIKKSKPAK